jgi:hypothetical protein
MRKDDDVSDSGLHRFLDDLLAVAPAVRPALEARGEAEPDLEIPVLWMASVGSALCDVYADLAPAERDAAFAVVEHHLVTGSEQLTTAVATGLLEDVASHVSGGRLDGPELATHLGPRSREFLDAYDAFTLGRSSLDPS